MANDDPAVPAEYLPNRPFTIYDTETGRILRSGDVPAAAWDAVPIYDGEAKIEKRTNPLTQHINLTTGNPNQGAIDPPEDPPPEPGPTTSAMVDFERNRRIADGMTFQGKRYQTRDFDQTNIAGAAQLASIAMSQGAGADDFTWGGLRQDPFGWIAEDNTIVLMDAPTVVLFGMRLAAHREQHIMHARVLKDMDPIPDDFTSDTYWPQA